MLGIRQHDRGWMRPSESGKEAASVGLLLWTRPLRGIYYFQMRRLGWSRATSNEDFMATDLSSPRLITFGSWPIKLVVRRGSLPTNIFAGPCAAIQRHSTSPGWLQIGWENGLFLGLSGLGNASDGRCGCCVPSGYVPYSTAMVSLPSQGCTAVSVL